MWIYTKKRSKPGKEIKNEDFEIDMETGEIIKTDSNSITDKKNTNNTEIIEKINEINEMKNKYVEDIKETTKEVEKENKIRRLNEKRKVA